MIGQSETWSSSHSVRSHLLHSSLAGVRVCCANPNIHQPQKIVARHWVKTILLSQTVMLKFSSSKFVLQDHIVSTTGDALKPSVTYHWSSSLHVGGVLKRTLTCPSPGHNTNYNWGGGKGGKVLGGQPRGPTWTRLLLLSLSLSLSLIHCFCMWRGILSDQKK